MSDRLAAAAAPAPEARRRSRRGPGRPGLVAALLVALLAVGACGSADRTSNRVQAILDDLVAQEYGRATARYEQHEEDVLSEAAAPAWRRGLEHGDPSVREWSVDALSRIGRPEDFDRLVPLLDDPFRAVREAAAAGIARIDAGAARGELLARLASDRPEQVTLAAGALADMEAEGAAGAIVERLRDPSLAGSVRGTLTTALARLGDPAAAEALADLAVDPGTETQLRRLAAEALVALEGPGVDAQLRRLLEADDEYVRDLAGDALGG